MGGKIVIEGKEVIDALGVGHLSLVYTDNKGGKYVIRGGPKYNNPFNFGSITVEVGVPLELSEDNRIVDNVQMPKEFFGYRELDLGTRKAEEVWGEMLRDALTINSANLEYDLDNLNSNTVVGYVLSRQGLSVKDFLPNNPLIDGSWFNTPYPGIEDVNIGFMRDNIPQCFPAGTRITLADGSRKTIERITTADRVLTFDDDGNACAGVVERTYRNTTTEFIRLVFDDGRDDLVATPGHAFLTEAGDYLEIAKMARLGGGIVRLVDCSGQIATAKAEYIAYSAETAHFFATSSTRAMAVSGNLMLKEDSPEGWATYNFEVRTTHNYVAGDIRVHNQSGMIGQLGDTLDTGLDRLSGVRDGDGSFLDKASDLINAGMHVVDRAMKNVSSGFSNIGNSIAIALLCALTVTGCYNFAISHKILNWQDEPKACSEFWDRNFSKAINGNSDAASDLFWAIMNRNLTPPGRQVNSYRGSKEMDFDTLALKRLSIHAYREPSGNAPVSRWSDSIWLGYSEEKDPRGVHRKTDEILKNYFCIISDSESPQILPGICSQRNGLENTTDEWAISCRKILANDDILPSTEEFLASIPEGKHACNYMDGSNAK